MAADEKKIKKLIEKSAYLGKRIKEDMSEKKKIDTQIKVYNYEKIAKKMESKNLSFDDVDSMLDRLEKKEIKDEKEDI